VIEMTDVELLESFQRLSDGHWVCVKPVLIDGTVRNFAIAPGTAISPVNMFMGFDLARELEAAAARLTQRQAMQPQIVF
jgi:hypothetical protein